MGAEGLERSHSTDVFAGGAQSAPLVSCRVSFFFFFFIYHKNKRRGQYTACSQIGGLPMQKLLMPVVLHVQEVGPRLHKRMFKAPTCLTSSSCPMPSCSNFLVPFGFHRCSVLPDSTYKPLKALFHLSPPLRNLPCLPLTSRYPPHVHTAWSRGVVMLMWVTAHDCLASSLGQILAYFTSGPDRAMPRMDAKEWSLNWGMVLKFQQSWTFC